MSGAMWRSKLGNVYPRADVEKLDSKHHQILKKLRSLPGNDQCADCGATDTTWASVNLGVFLCVRCSDVHRALGTHISKVKGCGGTYLWGEDEIAQMQRLGNSAWKGSEHCIFDSSTSKDELLRFCQRKYENQKPVPVATTCPSAVQKLPCNSAVDVTCAGVAPVESERPAQKSMKLKSNSAKPLDLDSFLEDCLKPSDPVTKAVPQIPSSVGQCNGNSSLQQELERCFLPAPKSQNLTVRSISGFDFDAFFDECSSSCKKSVPNEDDNKRPHEVPLHTELEVPMPQQNKSADTQAEFPGMNFNSDAFFDHFLSKTNDYSGTVSSKSSSLVW
eukprot:gnl/MRDRNA2_/MRDRNA2_88210_c0_seq1.p1 gnl/MRDRNA2_/MRDRNA2_88210_c0~~gnl/MRDRNA2_/MRDRNA2_88210_c0_seq1.p1  ORF type:complete len:332 (+),score=65.98 gnl/MRDRNA2_/MRDRNA2_88210_c0_seq1:90-1085(+)